MRYEINLKDYHASPVRSLGEDFAGVSKDGTTLSFNNFYLEKDGRPFFPVSGEFHYSRMDERRWEDELIKMPIGMREHFYYDMPRHTEQAIKQELIDHFGRYNYYRYHSAHRPITPDVLQVIQSVCQRHGWTQPLRFDDEVEDYVW